MNFANFASGALDLKRVRRGAKADYRSAAIEVVDDVLHLVVWKVLESEKHDEQVRCLESLEACDVGTSWFDEPGLRIRREEHVQVNP